MWFSMDARRPNRVILLPLMLLTSLVLLTWHGARCEQQESNGCINSFQQLEQSIISRDSNRNNLTDAFYPPNQPESIVANVQYFIETSETGRHNSTTPIYTFRWSESFVFALIRPELLQRLSMYVYYGYVPTAKIVIDPLCGMDILYNMTSHDMICSGREQAYAPVLLINKLTTHLKGYAKDNRLLGVDEKSRGYSSYVFNSNDHCVIGQVEKYRNIRIIVFTILFLVNIGGLTIFTTGVILKYYKTIQTKIEKPGTDRSSHLWIIIILMIPIEFALVGHALWPMYDGIQSEKVFMDIWWYYAICLVMIPFVFPLGNFITTIIIGLVLNNNYNIITTNPISCPNLFCSSKKWVIYVRHCAMISVLVYGAQLIVVSHGYFILLAFIASPKYTFSLLLFCILYFCFSITYMNFMFKALRKKLLYDLFVSLICCVLLGICGLSIVAFTMLGGEYYNNAGEIWSVIELLVPAVILYGLGYLGKRALNCCDVGEQESLVTKTATINFPSDNINIIRDQRIFLENTRRRDTMGGVVTEV